jgi:hypothetical protein
MKLIDKDVVVVEIEKKIKINKGCMLGLRNLDYYQGKVDALNDTLSFINTLKVKNIDLIIHTIIAECCDWLVMNTNLSHNEIEGCRNIMLAVKDEQLKVLKGE